MIGPFVRFRNTRAGFGAVKTAYDYVPLVAEIEALNLTSHGTLRFPVFRGLRSDIAPLACTVDQLDSLPRSGKSI